MKRNEEGVEIQGSTGLEQSADSRSQAIRNQITVTWRKIRLRACVRPSHTRVIAFCWLQAR